MASAGYARHAVLKLISRRKGFTPAKQRESQVVRPLGAEQSPDRRTADHRPSPARRAGTPASPRLRGQEAPGGSPKAARSPSDGTAGSHLGRQSAVAADASALPRRTARRWATRSAAPRSAPWSVGV